MLCTYYVRVFRYASRHDWGKIAKALHHVYTAEAAEAAEERLLELGEE